MALHRFASSATTTALVPIGVGQEVFDAVAVSGFLVGVEEHRHVVVGCLTAVSMHAVAP